MEQAIPDRAFATVLFTTVVVFYLLAYWAPLSPADAALFLILVSFTGQRIRPFLLVLAASVQDGPGYSYVWSYVAFSGIGAILVLGFVVQRMTDNDSPRDTGLERTVVGALLVVSYAIAVSAIQDNLGGYTQASSRPYVAVGGLMMLMILCGYISAAVLQQNARDRVRIGILAAIAVVHALAIGWAQILFGQSAYRSGTRLADVELANQLVEAGAIGFARINGPFLSPNAFGFTVLLFGLILVLTGWSRGSKQAVLFFAMTGGAAVLLSMSKALLGYYALSMLVLVRVAFGRAALISTMLLGALAAYVLMSPDTWQFVFDVFRVQQGSLGSREWSWLAVVRELTLIDWISGVGVSAWPEFFQQQVGIPLSDPHSVVLSIPGTYGLVGILFYVMLLSLFATRYQPDVADQRRLAVYLLLLLFLGKDLVSIPVLIGNTPLTFLIWLILGLSLGDWVRRTDGRRRSLKERTPQASRV